MRSSLAEPSGVCARGDNSPCAALGDMGGARGDEISRGEDGGIAEDGRTDNGPEAMTDLAEDGRDGVATLYGEGAQSSVGSGRGESPGIASVRPSSRARVT